MNAKNFFVLRIESWFVWIFNGNISAEYAVHPPSSKVAAMPDEVNANAIWFYDWMRASTNEMRNVCQYHLVRPKKKIRLIIVYIEYVYLILILLILYMINICIYFTVCISIYMRKMLRRGSKLSLFSNADMLTRLCEQTISLPIFLCTAGYI